MTIFPCSDFHFEFEPNAIEPILDSLPDAATIVVAGDLCTMCSGLAIILRELARRYTDVVYVAGNHEYYGFSPPHVATLREVITARGRHGGVWDNVHWLDCTSVEIENQRFTGCTLWFPETPGNETYRPGLADFRCIREFVPWVYEENRRNLAYLATDVQPGDIVVTHHLPSMQSSDPAKYNVETTRRFFACPDAEHIIHANRPSLWIHGHTHAGVDYRIGDTRVVCNPRGYKTDAGFNATSAMVLSPETWDRPGCGAEWAEPIPPGIHPDRRWENLAEGLTGGDRP